MEILYKNAKGYSLVEVLAAITIFSLIVIPMMSFFTQAYNNSNRNEKNTVVINVARGVFEFMKNQDFDELKARMAHESGLNVYVGLIDGSDIDPSDETMTKRIQVYKYQDEMTYEDSTIPDSKKVKQVQINNLKYNAYVTLKPNVDKPNYFIDIEVIVWDGDDKYSPPAKPTLTGMIINENIR